MDHREIQDMSRDSTSRLRDQRKYVGSQLELPLRCQQPVPAGHWYHHVNDEVGKTERGNDSRIIEAEGDRGEAARFPIRESSVMAPIAGARIE